MTGEQSGAACPGPVLRDVSETVAAAAARLQAVPGIRKRMGVVRLWPGRAAAEHENIERIRRTTQMIGAEVVVLDRQGGVVAEGGRPVTVDDVDFVLHLHFETPKNYAPISIGALWNPPKFYFDFGFATFWANQQSHDGFAWTGSEQVRRLMQATRGKATADGMTLLHTTLADPIYLPEARERYDAFYAGINWDQPGKRGRHQALLANLDRQGRLHAYGPETVRGVNVWRGFQGYRGPIPFDGTTMIRRIWDAGASLVFSSDAHIESGIMSNRLFEAMAAGAVVIGDDHPFIPQAIGENFVAVPMDLSASEQAEYVIRALDELGENPARGVAMATAAQDALIGNYFLCDQIVSLFESAERIRNRREAVVARARKPILDIVYQAADRSPEDVAAFTRGLRHQLGPVANIVIIAARDRADSVVGSVSGIAAVAMASGSDGRRLLNATRALDIARPYLKARKVCFVFGFETFLGALALVACEEFGNSPVGRLGYAELAESETDRSADKESEKRIRFRGGSLSAESKDDGSAAASYVFEREWLERNGAIPEISFRGLARLAARQKNDIPVCRPCALQVDLEAYSALRASGYALHDWTGGEAAFIDAFCAGVDGELSPDVTVAGTSALSPLTKVDLIGDAPMMLRNVSRAEWIGLLEDWYRALRTPRWLNWFARGIRRALRL